ncbi:MAG: hypothetical protein WAM14_16695 [Candidatus Nitrosopolaris sp.]
MIKQISLTTITFNILAIAAIVSLFGSQQVLAANLAGSGLVGYAHYGYGYHHYFFHHHGHYGYHHYHGHYRR